MQLDDDAEKKKDEEFMAQMEMELEDMEDDFLKEYRHKRIEEMRQAMSNM